MIALALFFFCIYAYRCIKNPRKIQDVEGTSNHAPRACQVSREVSKP